MFVSLIVKRNLIKGNVLANQLAEVVVAATVRLLSKLRKPLIARLKKELHLSFRLARNLA